MRGQPRMMIIPWGKGEEHAGKLRAGLVAMGPSYLASLCYWCEGTGIRNHEHCDVCGRGKPYGTALGLLMDRVPAPDSVVNQVLIAAERKS